MPLPTTPGTNSALTPAEQLDSAIEELNTPDRPIDVRVALHVLVAQLTAGTLDAARALVDGTRQHLTPTFVRAIARGFAMRQDTYTAVALLATVEDAETMRAYGHALLAEHYTAGIVALTAAKDYDALARLGNTLLLRANSDGFVALARAGQPPAEDALRTYLAAKLSPYDLRHHLALCADAGVRPPPDLFLPVCEAAIRMGRVEDALEAYDRLGIAPDESLLRDAGRQLAATGSHRVAAIALQRAGATDEARAAASALVEQPGHWDDGIDALARLGAVDVLATVGTTAFRSGDGVRARAALERAGDSALAITFGNACIRAGDAQEAVTYFALAVRLRDAAASRETTRPDERRS
ncbi:MAG: hypothetical protein M3P06_16425 [Acidobacteriota bacterium]|nr:hypothetical protein [Acidobacteriota bacterium]